MDKAVLSNKQSFHRFGLRGGLYLAIAAGVIAWGAVASARIEPFKVMTHGVKNSRAEVILMFDASGSIDQENGAGCTGDNPGTIDFTGDGMCTGYESGNPDCISKNDNSSAGFKTNCKNPNQGPIGGRLMMLKRVMRNVLPDFATVANFALITYPDHVPDGTSDPAEYFRYYRASGGTPKPVSIFLHRRELRDGGWTGGAGWDTMNNRPALDFTVNGVTYRRLDQAMAVYASITDDHDSLYRRTNGDGFADARFDWFYGGEYFSDGTNNWEYVGSYYTFEQAAPDTGNDRHETRYRGPQFVDLGTTYVYHKFDAQDSNWNAVSGNGRLFLPINPSEDQADQDQQMANLFNLLSSPWNGGIVTDSSGQDAPLGNALDLARQHFTERADGTGPFSAVGPDSLVDCRKRVVILLTDGKHSPSSDRPPPHAKDLFDLYPSDPADNPIRTYVVGMWPQNNKEDEIDQIADMGDDGLANFSAQASLADTEEELTEALNTTLVNALKGDFTTAAPGVTTITTEGGVQIMDNVTLIASTQFPGWKGKLRAVDVSKDPCEGTPNSPCFVELWEAGAQLEARDWKTRKLYTGYHDSDSGAPILMMKPDGTVNLDGTGFSTPVGIKDLWPGGTPPIDDDIIGLVTFLAGDNREWKLDPVVWAVPGTVGPPPVYEGLTGHDTFESQYSDRERFTYVTTNGGGLHALRTFSGNEAFVYIPPDLLPHLYDLWLQGGQDPDPRNFQYSLTTSPRIEDIPDGVGGWTTQLVMPLGDGGEKFIVLDVTSPTDCSTCPLNDPPFTLITHSDDLTGVSAANYLGKSWSLPAIYFDWVDCDSGDVCARMSTGAGYPGSDANDHEWYGYFPDLAPWDGTDADSGQHPEGASPLVDYGVIAASSGVVDFDSYRQVVAIYQADLYGRIVRYDNGVPDVATTTMIVDAGNQHPFHYAPTVYFLGGGTAQIAAVSGSFFENGAWTDNPLFVPRIFFFEDNIGAGTLDNRLSNPLGVPYDPLNIDSYSCRIDQICLCVGSPVGCENIPADARPTGDPLVIQNVLEGNALELFQLFYDPPPAVLTSCGGRVGDSYVLRLRNTGIGVNPWEIVSYSKYTSSFASGITLIGRGEDVAVAVTGIGEGAEATVATFSGGALQGLDLTGDMISEGIREVQ